MDGHAVVPVGGLFLDNQDGSVHHCVMLRGPVPGTYRPYASGGLLGLNGGAQGVTASAVVCTQPFVPLLLSAAPGGTGCLLRARVGTCHRMSIWSHCQLTLELFDQWELAPAWSGGLSLSRELGSSFGRSLGYV